MSLHANFLKRAFSFIVDLTVVILATILLFLFPFQQIITSSIDKNFKENIGNVADSINEKYEGKSSFLGTTEVGVLGELDNYYNNQSIDLVKLCDYKNDHSGAYYSSLSMVEDFGDFVESTYNSEMELIDQVYTKAYGIHGYLMYAYNCLSSFDLDDDLETLSKVKVSRNYSDEVITNKSASWQTKIKTMYGDALTVLIKGLNKYNEINSDFDVTTTTAYSNIASKYKLITGLKAKEAGVDYSSNDLDKIISFINLYNDFNLKNSDTSVLQVGDKYMLNQESYYSFYYDELILKFNEGLGIYEKYDNYTLLVVVYSLSMFVFLYSLYTILLRGYTLGRRVNKIKLSDGADLDKLSPLKALVHDVLFGFLYLILIGCFNLVVMLIVGFVFVITDSIMIRFTKQHKTIRGYLTKTQVIDITNR